MTIVLAGLPVDVFLEHEPPAAAVDLALVVGALATERRRLRAGLVVDDAPEGASSRVLVLSVAECTRSSPLECICQMYLSPPKRGATSKTVSKVRASGVVAHELAALIGVELRRLRGAPVPPFRRGPAQRVIVTNSGPTTSNLIRCSCRSSRASAHRRRAAGRAEEDQHRVAAHVVIRVPPIGVPDVVHAVGAAAILRIGQRTPVVL